MTTEGFQRARSPQQQEQRRAAILAAARDMLGRLPDVETALPPAAAHQRPRTRHELVAAAIAETLTEHRRFCDLLVACQTVLEHNVPVETARAFKTASLSRLNRLADLVRSRIPGLGDTESFEFAGLVWIAVAGAWPMAHPAPVTATVLAEPQFALLRVDFLVVASQILTVALDGLDSSR